MPCCRKISNDLAIETKVALCSVARRLLNTLVGTLTRRSSVDGLTIAHPFSQMFFKSSHGAGLSTRCGIILAAGEGNRLRSFVENLRGYALPKQYVNFT